jgi:PAS domain S-box-containing protein
MSEKPSLQELVDLNELQSIQDSFAKTVGTSSVIFSPEGEPLTQFSNPTRFCSLIQSTEEGRRRCFQSFMEMSRKAVGLKEPKILYCFAHGGHFVAPIIIDGEHKGTMFAGQFIPKSLSPEQLKELEKTAKKINLNPKLLVEEAKKMRVEEEAVWNYSSLLFQIVEVIARLGAQAAELNRAKDILQKAHNGLEIRVQERTAELMKRNEELKHEVTERKRAEEKLRLFSQAVDSSIDGVAMGDLEGRITYANEVFVRMFGYSREELIGKGIPFVYPEDQLPKLEEALKTTMEGGWTGELVAKRKGGELFPTAVTSSRVVDDEGKVIAHMASHRDITERKKAENELKEAKERYETLFEFATDGILIADIETREFKYANPALCRMLGYSVEELKRMGVGDIHPKDHLEHVISEFGAQVRGEKVLAPNIPCLRKDGTIIYADINGTKAPIDGIECNIGFFRDITERKQAEDVIKKRNEELKRFNRLAVGRELRMVELKTEINALLEQLGKEPRYKIAGKGFKSGREDYWEGGNR